MLFKVVKFWNKGDKVWDSGLIYAGISNCVTMMQTSGKTVKLKGPLRHDLFQSQMMLFFDFNCFLKKVKIKNNLKKKKWALLQLLFIFKKTSQINC